MNLHSRRAITGRLFRFALAVAAVAAAMAVLVSAPPPPGRAGAIIRRNLEQDVQASALFYMDLERMPRLEERLARTTRAARRPQAE
jgi:hypothetical protein